MSDQPFQFDRPGEHGFGPRTAGEGLTAAAAVEAQEALADRLRDEVLRNVDLLDEVTRLGDGNRDESAASGPTWSPI